MSDSLARAKVLASTAEVTGALADLRDSSTARTRSARDLGQAALARETLVLVVFSLESFSPLWEAETPVGF